MIPDVFDYKYGEIGEDFLQYEDCELNINIGDLDAGTEAEYIIWYHEDGVLVISQKGKESKFKVNYTFEKVEDNASESS